MEAMDVEQESPFLARFKAQNLSDDDIRMAHRSLRHIVHAMCCHKQHNDACPLTFCGGYRVWFDRHLRAPHTDACACSFAVADGKCSDVRAVFMHFMSCEQKESCVVCKFDPEGLVPDGFIAQFRQRREEKEKQAVYRKRASSAPVAMIPQGTPDMSLLAAGEPTQPPAAVPAQAGILMAPPTMYMAPAGWAPDGFYPPMMPSYYTPGHLSPSPALGAMIPTSATPMQMQAVPSPMMPMAAMLPQQMVAMMPARMSPSMQVPGMSYVPIQGPYLPPTPPSPLAPLTSVYAMTSRPQYRRNHASSCPIPYEPPQAQ
eukprot:m.224970 g.224970  ORF g.224970 m.224970 type:complete len:315 (-) comp11182_c0_seq1:255-1199(-)